MVKLPDGYTDCIRTNCDFTMPALGRLKSALALFLWGHLRLEYRVEVETHDGYLYALPAQFKIIFESGPERWWRDLRRRLFPSKPMTAQNAGGYCPPADPEPKGAKDAEIQEKTSDHRGGARQPTPHD